MLLTRLQQILSILTIIGGYILIIIFANWQTALGIFFITVIRNAHNNFNFNKNFQVMSNQIQLINNKHENFTNEIKKEININRA